MRIAIRENPRRHYADQRKSIRGYWHFATQRSSVITSVKRRIYVYNCNTGQSRKQYEKLSTLEAISLNGLYQDYRETLRKPSFRGLYEVEDFMRLHEVEPHEVS